MVTGSSGIRSRLVLPVLPYGALLVAALQIMVVPIVRDIGVSLGASTSAVNRVVTANLLAAAVLLIGRALQGLSYAILPLALGTLRDDLPPRRLTGAMAVVSGMLSAGVLWPWSPGACSPRTAATTAGSSGWRRRCPPSA
jgi:MFS family permease